MRKREDLREAFDEAAAQTYTIAVETESIQHRPAITQYPPEETQSDYADLNAGFDQEVILS